MTAVRPEAREEPAADEAGAHVVEGEAVSQRLGATYVDTADLRLLSAGVTLRRRTGADDAGWHLATRAAQGARPAVHLPLAGADRTVPEQLQRMVRALSRGADLHPVAEVTTVRTVRRLVDPGGHVLSELPEDRVMARTLLPTDGGDAAGASWREVDVELADGETDLLAAVDARLRAGGPGEAADLAAVLGGATSVRRAGRKDELTARSAAGEVVLAHVREQVAQVRAQDLPVRLDAPDSIHKMRVATRRLRSALTTFKPLFDAEVARPLRDELKWLAGELGAARDAEVMRDRVRTAVEFQGDDAAAGSAAGTATAELERTYRDAHDRVLAELDGERYHRVLEALDGLITSPPVTEEAARPAGKVVPKLVARSYRKVRRIVEEADAQPDGAEREELLHDARKAAKRARYAGESVSRVFGKDATAFAEAMEAVQEALGEHQDSVLTRERLRELAASTSSTDAAFLYGRLHALEEARAEQSHQHVDAAWKAAGRKRLHRWLR
jgi:CHAD domain-containing protein